MMLLRGETGCLCHRKNLLKVQGLSSVDKVKHPISPKALGAMRNGREIGGGIKVSTVGLAHNNGLNVAVFVFELVKKNTGCALRFLQ